MCKTGKSTSLVSVLQIAAFISERLKILETDLSIGRTHILLVLQPINHLLFSFLRPLPGPPSPCSSCPPFPLPLPYSLVIPACRISCARGVVLIQLHVCFECMKTMEACCHDDVMMAVKHNGSMHDVMVTM